MDLLNEIGPLPERVTVHLDRGYDSTKTREEPRSRGLHGAIAQKGKPAPVQAGQRWVVERTNAWHNAQRKPARMTIDRWDSVTVLIAHPPGRLGR